MVDRTARSDLASAIRDFINGQCRSFEFDARLWAIVGRTDDDLVREMSLSVWQFYDDCYDKEVRLSKSEWNYIQRLLLALESNAEFEVNSRPYRIVSFHSLAALSCVVFVAMVLYFGLFVWPLVSIPLGIAICAIHLMRRYTSRHQHSRLEAIVPFRSITDLHAALRQAQTFKKQPYLVGVSHHTSASIRILSKCVSLGWGLIAGIYACVLFLILSPIVLLIQAFPKREAVLVVQKPDG